MRKISKILALLAAGALLGSMTACQNNSGETTAAPETETSAEETVTAETETTGEVGQTQPAGTAKALVVYFSWSGNTRNVAEEIAAQTGADIFELIPAAPYSEDYNTVLDEAKQEQTEDARPEISGTIDGFDGYDQVFLGFPNWWGDMPMIVYSFLDNYDLSGKTILPFCTSGGSRFSDSLNTIGSMEPEAEVLDGLSLGSFEAGSPENAVSEWLDSIGYSEKGEN